MEIPGSEQVRMMAGVRFYRDLLALEAMALSPAARIAEKRKAREIYDESLRVLSDVADARVEPEKKSIIAQFGRGGVSGAVNGIANLSVRLDYLKQIGAAARGFTEQLVSAGENVELAQKIVKQAVERRNELRDLHLWQTLSRERQAQKAAMSAVTKFTKEIGFKPSQAKTPENLLRAAAGGKEFTALSEAEQLAACRKVLAGAGNSSWWNDTTTTATALVKTAMLVLTATMIIAEMSEAWNPAEVATRGVSRLAVGFASAELGVMAGSLLAPTVVSVLGAAIGANAAGPVGTVVSVILCSYVIAKVGEAVVDLACDELFAAVNPRIPQTIRADMGSMGSLTGFSMKFSLEGDAGEMKASLLSSAGGADLLLA